MDNISSLLTSNLTFLSDTNASFFTPNHFEGGKTRDENFKGQKES